MQCYDLNFVKEFHDNGYVILKQFFSKDEIDSVVNLIKRLILNEGKKIGGKTYEKLQDMDSEKLPHEGILLLKSINHEHMRRVVDQLNVSSYFHKFITNEKIINLAKEVTGAEKPEDVAFSFPFFRVDLPAKYKEEKNRFSLHWHQDSGYYDLRVSKTNSVVINTPVFDCGKTQGCLVVKKRSHKEGPVKHQEHYEDEEKKKHRRVVIPNEVLQKYDDVFVETISGDIFINHFNTFHLSGLNESNMVRYTMLVRVSNSASDDFII